ncbi:thiamine pyrophosphate enzyme [Talaromyces proteolyticus]|uniref:Thiamine pyrophosphate enzyme n=1 Tax=Talaromyces proteolyticus TaxID=1131652 RepID=A0AAD4KEJ3_9EURO|nr:thiamine pyrophosphate enzyme [Talaromyces proteolyticus]KAH8689804.1 thiamine pyrophosphate enzyme [Talaromyces proteolyticus]
MNSGEYSTAFALFEGLWEAGVKNCFVNIGSDHPPIVEAIVKGKRERPSNWPRFVTCPSEMTAISMADGHARVTGRPQAVIVHVDVGTQALAHGVHNASVGRAPVFIFAGLCPITESGELTGSRTEYMHWLQEPHDQKAIVRQYCRYVGEVRTGSNVKETLGRALQFASSTPKGPVYVVAAREVLAQAIRPYSLDQEKWVPIGPAALPDDAVRTITEALVGAERPLVITGYSGRDRRTPELLVELADKIPGLRVHDTGGSDMCFPFDHPASLGFRLAFDECTRDADVVLILDCDVPWIPARNPPREDAKFFHIDVDPLNQQIPVSFFPAHGRWKADCYLALKQMLECLDREFRGVQQDSTYIARKQDLVVQHKDRLDKLAKLPQVGDEASLDGHNIGRLLKECLPEDTTFVVEAVTCVSMIADQLQPTRPGSWINCGGTGIGWSNGAALGVRMAMNEEKVPGIVCQVVGDGSFMCGSPTSAIWASYKHKIPILTVVLNNGAWKAPRNSAELVYPSGLNKTATDDELNVSLRPSPDYSKLAEAAATQAGWLKGSQAKTVKELREQLIEAANIVQMGRSALVDAVI